MQDRIAGIADRSGSAIALAIVVIASAYVLASCSSREAEKDAQESPYKQIPAQVDLSESMEGVDFSTFRHDSGRHSEMPCLLCHLEQDGNMRPQFAKHQTCAGCHAQQFADGSHQICTTCHTASGTADLRRFPSIKSFTAKISHSAHFKETNCSTCHKPQGKVISIPAGANAHAACFQCHTSDKVVGERNIGSCSTCHEPGQPQRISAGSNTVGFNFDHSNHSGVSCDSCHATNSDSAAVKIRTAMHSNTANSCATCHNGRRAFGAANFRDCRQCHSEMPAGRSFGVKFDHNVHASQSCATCHKGTGGGVNFSVPNSTAAHATCYQCHAPSKRTGGSFMSASCFTCHKQGETNDIKPSRASIPGNFSHTKHAGFDCDSCHDNTGGKMDVPLAVMHKPSGNRMSCASCHNGSVAFGNEFTNCKQCHTGGKFNSKGK
jgi:c(7)-type cytochrome triheme protein